MTDNAQQLDEGEDEADVETSLLNDTADAEDDLQSNDPQQQILKEPAKLRAYLQAIMVSPLNHDQVYLLVY